MLWRQVEGGACVAFSLPSGAHLAVGSETGQLHVLATTTLATAGPEPGLTRCQVHGTSRAGARSERRGPGAAAGSGEASALDWRR